MKRPVTRKRGERRLRMRWRLSRNLPAPYLIYPEVSAVVSQEDQLRIRRKSSGREVSSASRSVLLNGGRKDRIQLLGIQNIGAILLSVENELAVPRYPY